MFFLFCVFLYKKTLYYTDLVQNHRIMLICELIISLDSE